MSRGCSRISGVDPTIHEPVKRHRSGSGKHHAEQNSDQVQPLKRSARQTPRHHRAQQCKWQSEDGVTEANQFKKVANFGHGTSTEQIETRFSAHSTRHWHDLNRNSGANITGKRLRATVGSSVPRMMTRPSGKTVISSGFPSEFVSGIENRTKNGFLATDPDCSRRSASPDKVSFMGSDGETCTALRPHRTVVPDRCSPFSQSRSPPRQAGQTDCSRSRLTSICRNDRSQTSIRDNIGVIPGVRGSGETRIRSATAA